MRPRHPAAAWIGLWLTGLALLGLPGCGGGTDPLPAPDTLSRSSAEPAGAHSAHGGTRFEAGLDLDRDQVLDDDEVTRTDYVCRPAGVAWVEVSEASVQAVANTGYRTAGSADITLTLPATDTLAVGDLVSVAGGGTGAWTLAQNAGQTVYGGSLGHLAVSWTPREENRGWQAVASSADGQRLAAVEYGGRIYTSTDAGETWTARDSDRLWYTIASSADGLHLVAGVPGGQLYTSADGGLNWTARESNRLWFSVAMSADGERMVAAEYGGQVYTSTDRGVNWTPRETNRAWASLTASSDGLRLVGLVFGGQIHTSGDGGITWSARASVVGGLVCGPKSPRSRSSR